jgi:hypothetical protein
MTEIIQIVKIVNDRKYDKIKGIDIKKYTKDYNTQYYITHKDALNIKIRCSCGGSYTKLNKFSHQNTKKHHNYLSEREVILKNT